MARKKQQIKAIRYHLPAVRMAIIKNPKMTNTVEDVEKKEPLYTVGGMYISTAIYSSRVTSI
jgi:hypothetical protein